MNRLAFLNSYIKECTYANIFVMGDLNPDISDDKSLFGQHLLQFCQDSKLVLSSMNFLPAGSYTYVSEAWNTSSWLDHVICTADAHESLEKV